MAGIGFELRKLLEKGSYLGVVKAYGCAGLISAGPWVLSICGVFAIGLFRLEHAAQGVPMQQFQISVTYLMVFSFLLTSPIQLPFTRFVADQMFKNEESVIFANILGVLTMVFWLAGALGGGAVLYFFDGSVLYRLLMLTGLVLLSGIWMLMSVLSGVREYLKVLLGFLLGYGASVGVAFIFREYGLEGLLSGYILGQAILFFFFLALVLRRFGPDRLIRLGFFQRDAFYPRLALTGGFFALGMWADKFIFWWNPYTSVTVLGPMRVSEIYDLPIFLAYLCIIPGMASFLVRVETDFAEKHEAFYSSLNRGASLAELSELRDAMIVSVRHGLKEIFKIQGMTIIILIAVGPKVLEWVGISPLYRLLLNVDMVAVSVQVMLMAIFNVFSYLDLQGAMVKLSIFFALSNALLTAASQYFGPTYYGYGFASSMIATTLIGLAVLSRAMERLVYRTFTIQKAYL